MRKIQDKERFQEIKNALISHFYNVHWRYQSRGLSFSTSLVLVLVLVLNMIMIIVKVIVLVMI